MKSTVVPNPWCGAVKYYFMGCSNKMNMCEDHVYDMFCECKLLNTKECPQGHFDFLTFTTLLQHRDTLCWRHKLLQL